MNKRMQIFFVIASMLHQICSQDNSTQNYNQAISNISDSLKNLWNGGKQFVQGMGQSFGLVSSDYYYNFIVFNDAPKSIFVAKQHITGFMGTKFSGDIDNSMTLKAGENTGDTFKKQQLYASVWLCGDQSQLNTYAKSSSQAAAWGTLATPLGTILGGIIGGIITADNLKDYKIFSRDLDLGKKNDPNWYYYRTYTYQGKVQGEYLGVKANSNEFAGVFFNNTSEKTIYLSFTKDGSPYTVLLEPNSFSLLQSTSGVDGSIRPKSASKASFQFYNTADKTFNDATSIAYIPISSVGIANISIDPTTQAQTISGPMTYTYEVQKTQDQITVGIQGLAVGHYDQPCSYPCQIGQTLSLVRDINPAECHVWLMSADQAQQQASGQDKTLESFSNVYYDGSDQLWISYKSQDYTYQQKITPGSVFDFGIIRPRLSEQQATLYVVSLQTTDEGAAKKFLDRLTAGKIGQGAVYANVNSDDIQQFLAGKTNVLVSPQPNTNGIIDDRDTLKDSNASGITGEILLADIFTPRGIGIGPFYYSIQPSSLQLSSLAAGLYLADENYDENRSLKDVVMQDLSTRFISWIESYQKDKTKVKNDVFSYIQQHGNPNIFTNPNAQATQRILTDIGNRMLDDILTGPISIANPPRIRHAGKNYYVYTLGGIPDGWPLKKKAA